MHLVPIRRAVTKLAGTPTAKGFATVSTFFHVSRHADPAAALLAVIRIDGGVCHGQIIFPLFQTKLRLEKKLPHAIKSKLLLIFGTSFTVRVDDLAYNKPRVTFPQTAHT